MFDEQELSFSPRKELASLCPENVETTLVPPLQPLQQTCTQSFVTLELFLPASTNFRLYTKDALGKRKKGFPTGSAAGASGTRPQFFKDILSCPNKAVSDEALTSLTKLANHLVAGLAPRELAPFVAGAPLMALAKAGGGLRPIAIGETIRRLVSKCCCEATVEDAKIIFGSLQVGVATSGGAEASVHAVRRLAKEFGEDPGKIMLKVDFSNASNLVNRTEMLAQVFEKLPGLYRWVEYCYSHPALLFFGTSALQSATALSFSLVLHPLALKIEAEFPDLDLCLVP